MNKIKDNPTAQYFDGIDLHWSGQFERFESGANYLYIMPAPGTVYELNKSLFFIKQTVAKNGYYIVPVWITEMSDYSGKLLSDFEFSYHIETDQEDDVDASGILNLTLELVPELFSNISIIRSELATYIFWSNSL